MAGLKGVPLSPRRRTGLRPYAGRSQPYPSVTAVIGVLDKPGLPWAAARETATYAVLHAQELDSLTQEARIDRLYRHHRGLWDGRAAMGNLVHGVNEAWTWDESPDIAELIEQMLAGKRRPKIWEGHEDQVAQEASGYIDGLERFWNDFTPETIATEEVVRHPVGTNSYIGQRDWVFESRGDRWLCDVKTTKEQDAEKALYSSEWRLQLAGYRFAEQLVLYDKDGKEEGTAPNYPVDRCGVIHLRGGGDYTLYELQVGVSEHTRFLQARCIWTWLNKEAKSPAPHVVKPASVEAVAG